MSSRQPTMGLRGPLFPFTPLDDSLIVLGQHRLSKIDFLQMQHKI